MWQFETSISKVINQTSDIKTFRFNFSDQPEIRYEPGQFFYVTIKVRGAEATHHFSISTSPTETAYGHYIDFTKKITRSEYSLALDNIKIGDLARVRGAMGNFTIPVKSASLVFISGGIGITPLRSMLRYIVDRGLKQDVVLIYGNSSLQKTAFRKELDGMSKNHDNVRVEYVLSGPDIPPEWEGKRGRITGDVILDLVPDFEKRDYYLSGPYKMVTRLEEQLACMNIPETQIKRDYFPGYD